MNRRNVVITGMGLVSSLGWSPEENQAALYQKKRGFRPLTCLNSPVFTGVLAGEVCTNPAEKSGLSSGSRTDHLALYAAKQAYYHAQLETLPEVERHEIGVILGITTGGLSTTEKCLENLLKNQTSDLDLMRYHECSTSAATIARELHAFGFQSSVSNACASGANALTLARDCIQQGEADLVIAGGVDSLSRLTMNGFNSLMVYDHDGCRPFDMNRAGMTLGEGAGILVLEEEDHARARGATLYAGFIGAGSSCDAYHVTAPSPDGSAISKAMKLALDDAGCRPEDIDYINAHGTGTRENDSSEAAAIRDVFGKTIPMVSSTKGSIGHTLAAAGALEAIISIMAMRQGRAPANVGLETVDPTLGLSPLVDSVEAAISTVISNSIGFGGNNCSLIFEKCTP